MRGERIRQPRNVTPGRGSSPHARGTLRSEICALPERRFIPACAGNASRRSDALLPHPVHPRMRGERCLVAGLALLSIGSSPHARGTLSDPFCIADGIRFIPACAGNAISGSSSAFSCFGSSPHARGTPSRGQLGPRCLRFIPACAGNACPAPLARCRCTVHPRMRGERGCGVPDIDGVTRFIPACAGNALGFEK